MKSVLLFLVLPLVATAAPTSLQFLQTASQVLPMSNGAILTLGAGSLTINDASGNQTAALPGAALGHGESGIVAAAIDAAGNIWIIGQTTSTDFPLLHPLYTTTAASNAFVAKLSPNLNILFSTFLQGPSAKEQTTMSAIALDKSGNAYIVGSTDDPAFPVTGANLGPGGPSIDTRLVPTLDVFISEIAADGSALIYGRLLGGSISACTGGSACETASPSSRPNAVAVDSTGNLVVVGTTSAQDFPVTVTPYPNGRYAFITRIAAGGQMSWSTEVTTLYLPGSGSFQSVAFDLAGNVYAAGNAHGPITGTPNALQPTYAPAVGGTLISTGFVMKLSPDGTRMLYATNLVGANGSRLTGMTFDSSGNVWATGCTSSTDFPGLRNVPPGGVDFALELNADASALQQVFTFLPRTICPYSIFQSAQPAFDSFGRILLLGDTGNLLRWNPDATATTSAIFGLTDSASPLSMTGVSPGELATLYGVGIGPATGIVATPDANGLYPTTLGGVTVGFSAGFAVIPAPLLYVGPGQINFQAPFGLNATTPLIVTTPTGPLPALPLSAFGSVGIFGVINPDGSVNSSSNPAPTGSAVAIYATGLGAPDQPSQNGAISTTADNAFQNSIQVQYVNSSGTLPVLYAGTAPTLINGLDQINVQLPHGQNPQLRIQTAHATSNQITVYTH